MFFLTLLSVLLSILLRSMHSRLLFPSLLPLECPPHLANPAHPGNPDPGSPCLKAFPAPAGRLTHPRSLSTSSKVATATAVWPPWARDRETLGRGTHSSHGRTPTRTPPDRAQWFSEPSEPQDPLPGLVKHIPGPYPLGFWCSTPKPHWLNNKSWFLLQSVCQMLEGRESGPHRDPG